MCCPTLSISTALVKIIDSASISFFSTYFCANQSVAFGFELEVLLPMVMDDSMIISVEICYVLACGGSMNSNIMIRIGQKSISSFNYAFSLFSVINERSKLWHSNLKKAPIGSYYGDPTVSWTAWISSLKLRQVLSQRRCMRASITVRTQYEVGVCNKNETV